MEITKQYINSISYWEAEAGSKVYAERAYYKNFKNRPIRILEPTELVVSPDRKNLLLNNETFNTTCLDGSDINVFDNMTECIDNFYKSITFNLPKLKEYKDKMNKHYDSQIARMEKYKKEIQENYPEVLL